MENKLTVIMSSYNQASYISKAIDSVLAQKTDFKFQLIITDDYSQKDNTVQIIKKYQKANPDKILALLNEENGRYLKNILRAKSITKTPYFTLLDADDYWTDEYYLQKGVDYLESHPEYTVYSTNVMVLEENGHTRPYIQSPVKEKDFTMEDVLKGSALVPQTTGMLFRNVVYNRGIPETIQNAIGTPAERSYEGDYDRYMMHIEKGKAHYINEISGVYRLLPAGIWVSMNPFEQSAITARGYIDWYAYLGKYRQELFTLAKRALGRCMLQLIKDSNNNFAAHRKEAQDAFFYTMSFLKEHCPHFESSKKSLKTRLYLKLLKKIIRYFEKNPL